MRTSPRPLPAAVARCTLTLAAVSALFVAPAAAQMAPDPGLSGAQRMYEMARDYLLATARDVPADLYAYRPTPEVRTLGEILGHVGNASYAFCSVALGERSPARSNLEEAPDKASLVAGLEAAFAYCDRAYAEVPAQRLGEEVNLFGMTGSRLWVLIFNATHDWEHYGNLVTYMRLNGIVPPSSRAGM